MSSTLESANAGFLERLLDRAAGNAVVVQPRPLSLFEPDAVASTTEPLPHAFVEVDEAAEVRRSVTPPNAPPPSDMQRSTPAYSPRPPTQAAPWISTPALVPSEIATEAAASAALRPDVSSRLDAVSSEALKAPAPKPLTAPRGASAPDPSASASEPSQRSATNAVFFPIHPARELPSERDQDALTRRWTRAGVLESTRVPIAEPRRVPDSDAIESRQPALADVSAGVFSARDLAVATRAPRPAARAWPSPEPAPRDQVVNVTIERLEVRAGGTKAPARSERRGARPLSLDDYLKGREGAR